MRRWFLAAALGAPLLVSLVLVGCGRPRDDMEFGSGDGGGAQITAGTAELKPLAAKPGAVLTGKVTIQGSPDVDGLNQELKDAILKKFDDKTACYDLAPPDEKEEQKWKLAKDGSGGVRNVVVWIQPPANGYFAVDPNDKTWPDTVELNQPHCAFVPHVTWAMPTLVDPNDPRKTVPSGQKFLVSNTAQVSHNTTYKAQIGSISGELGTLPSGTKDRQVALKGNNALVQFTCSIHPWMTAYVWVFNHPYAAVTDEHGKYEIKNVPVGSKVRIMAWHEMGPNNGYLTPSMSRGDEIELKDDATVHDFTLTVGAK